MFEQLGSFVFIGRPTAIRAVVIVIGGQPDHDAVLVEGVAAGQATELDARHVRLETNGALQTLHYALWPGVKGRRDTRADINRFIWSEVTIACRA